MRKRPLGRTGLLVSELSLGTWGLAGDGYGPITEQEGEAVIRRALDIGIGVFDTADAYGAGKMESLLGRVLKSRSDAIVVTKGGTDRTTDPPRKRFDAAYLREAVERSRKRLQRDRLDVYLLHNPSVDALNAGEAIDCMKELKAAGRIKHIGVSAGDAEVARAALDQGAEVVSLTYNLMHAADLHRVTGDIMVEGAGVLVHSVLAFGLLSGSWAKIRSFPEHDHRYSRWTPPELERRVEQVEGLRFLVQGDIPSLRGAAVRFALAHHVVSSAVLGPRSVAQLEQLVRETGGGPVYLPNEAVSALPRQLQRLGLSL